VTVTLGEFRTNVQTLPEVRQSLQRIALLLKDIAAELGQQSSLGLNPMCLVTDDGDVFVTGGFGVGGEAEMLLIPPAIMQEIHYPTPIGLL